MGGMPPQARRHDGQLIVRGDGWLVPCTGGQDAAAGEVFEVMEVWVTDDPIRSGPVTPIALRSLRIAQADADDDAFQRWLRDLPDWNPAKLSHAIKSSGFHLVWRRPG